jgi:hypothetical protein
VGRREDLSRQGRQRFDHPMVVSGNFCPHDLSPCCVCESR